MNTGCLSVQMGAKKKCAFPWGCHRWQESCIGFDHDCIECPEESNSAPLLCPFVLNFYYSELFFEWSWKIVTILFMSVASLFFTLFGSLSLVGSINHYFSLKLLSSWVPVTLLILQFSISSAVCISVCIYCCPIS